MICRSIVNARAWLERVAHERRCHRVALLVEGLPPLRLRSTADLVERAAAAWNASAPHSSTGVAEVDDDGALRIVAHEGVRDVSITASVRPPGVIDFAAIVLVRVALFLLPGGAR